MLRFIKNLFKDKEKEKMELLLHSLVLKAYTNSKKELITGKNGVTQLIYEVRLPESFIEDCAPFAQNAAKDGK
jgi:hypothetical protein